jgi:IgGFc binding protein
VDPERVNCTKFVAVWLLAGLAFGCSAGGSDKGKNGGTGATSSGGSAAHGGGSVTGPDIDLGGAPPVDPGGGDDNNPTTCEQAAKSQTYIGCDFWPTVTYNPVYHEFAFAVVVANGGSVDADVDVQRLGASVATAKVPAGGLATIKLPWVMELKGEEFTRTDATTGARKKESVLAKGGAYHMTSSVPVTTWQFSPLDYQQPAANCPGLPAGTEVCLSVSNDASLLLPSTAMTGTYRLAGRSARLEGGGIDYTSSQGGFAITATKDDTKVDLQLSADRKSEPGAGAKIGPAVLAAGTGVAAAMPGETVSYTLQAGDVLELVGQWAAFEPEPHGDLSGSLLNATKPVQVIAFNALLNGVPTATDGNPDHIEETVLPAEVIGKSYVVAPPTGPDKRVPGHMVRFFGNFDGTTLTYPAGMPAGAPTTLKAGEVVEIGPVTDSFVVDGGDKSFSVASIMLGGTKQDPDMMLKRGDPSLTMEVTPEQFRKQYTFLAPTTYLQNYADIVIPTGANVTLDGQPLTGTPEAIGSSNWSLVREPLSAGQDGAHRLEASEKVGLQVLGFGSATSYCYPGGLDLKPISDAPTIVK